MTTYRADITALSTEELLQDLVQSQEDIALCDTALSLSIQDYKGGSVAARRLANEKKIEAITVELERRRAANANNRVGS